VGKEQRSNCACCDHIFPEKTIDLSKEQLAKHDQLVLFTDIQVFGNKRIILNQSGLTSPIYLEDLSQFQENGKTLTMHYKLGANPGVEYALK